MRRGGSSEPWTPIANVRSTCIPQWSGAQCSVAHDTGDLAREQCTRLGELFRRHCNVLRRCEGEHHLMADLGLQVVGIKNGLGSSE